MAEMRVAACQILTFPEPEASADKVIAWMQEAVRDGVEVVAFPEACLCGYACDPEYWKRADPEAFREAEERVVTAAAQLQLGVVLGTVHWEEGVLYNSLLVIDRDGGVRGRYAKTHLAENWPAPGRRLPAFGLGGRSPVLSSATTCAIRNWCGYRRWPAPGSVIFAVMRVACCKRPSCRRTGRCRLLGRPRMGFFW